MYMPGQRLAPEDQRMLSQAETTIQQERAMLQWIAIKEAATKGLLSDDFWKSGDFKNMCEIFGDTPHDLLSTIRLNEVVRKTNDDTVKLLNWQAGGMLTHPSRLGIALDHPKLPDAIYMYMSTTYRIRRQDLNLWFAGKGDTLSDSRVSYQELLSNPTEYYTIIEGIEKICKDFDYPLPQHISDLLLSTEVREGYIQKYYTIYIQMDPKILHASVWSRLLAEAERLGVSESLKYAIQLQSIKSLAAYRVQIHATWAGHDEMSNPTGDKNGRIPPM